MHSGAALPGPAADGPAAWLRPCHTLVRLALRVLKVLRARVAWWRRVHGTSLATLFRKMRAGGGAQLPTLTLIQDHGGHVFGCYTPEGWRIAPRYYGSGETFVFQLEVRAACGAGFTVLAVRATLPGVCACLGAAGVVLINETCLMCACLVAADPRRVALAVAERGEERLLPVLDAQLPGAGRRGALRHPPGPGPAARERRALCCCSVLLRVGTSVATHNAALRGGSAALAPQGSSDVCGTFGSPCLAVREDYKIVVVEVWQCAS